MGLRAFIMGFLLTFLIIGILEGSFQFKGVIIGFAVGLILFILWQAYKKRFI